MVLSWNEIKDRALKFSKEWENDFNEDAEAKSFMDDFFNVFGVPRRRVATFEVHVKKEGGKQGFIDLLWKGNILIEFKSRGKDLDKAHQQAKDYFPGIKDNELPKYILVSDFANFRLYDLEENTTIEFKLEDLVQNVQHFGFMIGYQKKVYKEQDPANIRAAELMGKLHDRLEEIGYEGHPLEVYLVRILFCLFAEDTSIFEPQQFQDYIEYRTAEDGSDLAGKMYELFHVLNTPKEKRLKNLDEDLNNFPYVNGKLFEEPLPTASFDSKMRRALLECCYINWSKISPAIFGSMFQSVMNPKERRNLGAHYTSETNILKLIKPLFLDELWAEFESIKSNKNKLAEFHKRISTLKFLDPACGCGNFLVITYRELRLLELEILRTQYKNQYVTQIESIIWLDVDMMYGIEYEEFPARIAEVAMWLIDHQMNQLISNEFGQYFVRLPLKKAARIVHADALEKNWEEVVSKKELTHIIGNPPFIGSRIMSQLQRNQLISEFDNIKNSGVLDYVAAWYVKAAKFIQATKIKAAFVSTNSIVQGEQTSILWTHMLYKYGIKIHFAHKTFKWSNEAKGNAAVYCVIVGFANFDTNSKALFEYEDIKGEPLGIKVKNINPYLVDAKDFLIEKSSTPLCKTPKLIRGSIPYDDGNLLLSEKEVDDLSITNKELLDYIKKYGGANELINKKWRYCLWLKDISPELLRNNSYLKDKIQKVYDFRITSKGQSVKSKSNTPSLFGDIRQPTGENYLLIPRHSSERRKFIPIGFVDQSVILADSAYGMPDATLYHFGILTSSMHMIWVNYVCGRIKSDYRYSSSIVYNNYPWPENPTEKQINAIEEKAQAVLNAREMFPNSSLADLYSPLTMPPALVKAHNELDKAVDAAYSKQAFTSEAKRMEFLFELYEKYTADLFSKEKVKKVKNKLD